MDKCREQFEAWYGLTVCEDMDIQTACAWSSWIASWNAAIHASADQCERLRVNGKGIRGQVDRAALIAFKDVMSLEHCAAAPIYETVDHARAFNENKHANKT